MNMKYFKLGFILFICVNVFLMWTGVFLPWLISTNKLPLTFIFIILTAGVLGIFTLFFYLLENVNKKKIVKVSCLTRKEVLLRKAVLCDLTEEEKIELSHLLLGNN
jgi:hypothetical protein